MAQKLMRLLSPTWSSLRLCTGVLACQFLAFTALAQIEWRATLSMGKSQSFSLASSDGQQTAWVSPGDSFAGYTVEGLTGDALVLKKGEESLSLNLASTTITDAKDATAQAEDLLRTMKFNEMIDRMVEQQKKSMATMTRQMAGSLGGKEPSKEQLALQEKIQDTMFKEIFNESFSKDLAKLYAKVLAPSELKALTDFYSTQAGQGFIDKQPKLMEGMMQMMQPRMMAAMPKIQAMMAEGGALPVPPSAPPQRPPSK